MSGSADPDKNKQSKCGSPTTDNAKDNDTDSGEASQDQQSQHGVRRKLRTLTFGRRRKTLKDSNKKRKCSWTFKFPSRSRHIPQSDAGEGTSSGVGCSGCVCTVYRRTEDCVPNSDEGTMDRSSQSSPVLQDPLPSLPIVDLTISGLNSEDYPVEDWDEHARLQRAREIAEGVDPPPGFKPSQSESHVQEIQLSEPFALCLQSRLLLVVPPAPYLERFSSIGNEAARLSRDVLTKLRELHFQVTNESFTYQPTIHTQVDYIHCLVPDLLEITNCSFYWGKMDRYEAEKLLENKPEGTFLLRDSAQEEYLFSVSFQRYGRSLHARIEQWNHKFSFDSHDPGVFASNTVCGLIEHYKDPTCCMYFEPMLTIPLHRTFPFSLQHLCRAVISSKVSYNGINLLQLPRTLKAYLKEYHYRQRVRVRRFDDS